MVKLTLEKRQLCDIQGRLFMLAQKAGTAYPLEAMYWIGYTYRYWHYYTKESSREISQIADAKTMEECWPGFHTLDVEMAIDNLKEISMLRKEADGV